MIEEACVGSRERKSANIQYCVYVLFVYMKLVTIKKPTCVRVVVIFLDAVM